MNRFICQKDAVMHRVLKFTSHSSNDTIKSLNILKRLLNGSDISYVFDYVITSSLGSLAIAMLTSYNMAPYQNSTNIDDVIRFFAEHQLNVSKSIESQTQLEAASFEYLLDKMFGSATMKDLSMPISISSHDDSDAKFNTWSNIGSRNNERLSDIIKHSRNDHMYFASKIASTYDLEYVRSPLHKISSSISTLKNYEKYNNIKSDSIIILAINADQISEEEDDVTYHQIDPITNASHYSHLYIFPAIGSLLSNAVGIAFSPLVDFFLQKAGVSNFALSFVISLSITTAFDTLSQVFMRQYEESSIITSEENAANQLTMTQALLLNDFLENRFTTMFYQNFIEIRADDENDENFDEKKFTYCLENRFEQPSCAEYINPSDADDMHDLLYLY